MALVLIAIALLAFSGFPGLLIRRGSAGQPLSCAMMVLGAALGVVGAFTCLFGGEQQLVLSWGLPIGRLSLGIDALSAVFMLPVFVVAGAGSVYGMSYWKQEEHPENGRKLRLFYGLLAASLAMVPVARDGVLFLVAWEVMALSAYFAVTTEDDDPAVREAGWIYLIATHLATLCLMAMFALLCKATGSFAIAPIASVSPALASAIFILAIIGFGMKAGIMPLHVWLPGSTRMPPATFRPSCPAC